MSLGYRIDNNGVGVLSTPQKLIKVPPPRNFAPRQEVNFLLSLSLFIISALNSEYPGLACERQTFLLAHLH